MNDDQNIREKVINEIIDIELEMFQTVKTYAPSKCSENIKTFKLMRWMSHSVLPAEILNSLLSDLKKARQDDRNLMTEKYARMENLIPPLSSNPLIEKIVKVESKWMKKLNKKYPLVFRDSGGGFEKYFACELETYSDETLLKYYNYINQCQKGKSNLIEQRYNNLFFRQGYKSIAEKEYILKEENSNSVSGY